MSLTYHVGPTLTRRHAGLVSLSTEIVRTSATSPTLPSTPSGWTPPTRDDIDAQWLSQLPTHVRESFSASFDVAGQSTGIELSLPARVKLTTMALVVRGEITDVGLRVRALMG